MIIVDFQQVCISNLFAILGAHTNIDVDENILRHMVLNSIRGYNVKFKKKYGEMVIACDSYKNWRRDVNPYYKANRKKARDASDLNWDKIFSHLNIIKDELKTIFPYRVIQVDRAEADDVIGTLCRELGNTGEKIIIISGDKDFKQLQKYMNVVQYDPVRNKYLEENDPRGFLMEHIIRGDTGDGVCNIKSPANSFVLGTRQKAIRSKDVEVWRQQNPEEFCDTDMLIRFEQNKKVIDLDEIPEDISNQIMLEYAEQEGKDRSKLFTFFVEKKLKNLLKDLNDF